MRNPPGHEVQQLQAELSVLRGAPQAAEQSLAAAVDTLCQPAVQLLEAEVAEAKMRSEEDISSPANVEDAATTVRRETFMLQNQPSSPSPFCCAAVSSNRGPSVVPAPSITTK